MPTPNSVLLDARLAIRGLGIATFIERLMTGFASTDGPVPVLWKATANSGYGGMVGTLTRSGLFDVSPRLEPRARGFDVVHFACNVGALIPGRNSVLTVHDLMHRRSKKRRSHLLGRLLELSLVRAGCVVAVSSKTAQEVLKAFPSLAGRVEVIPHGLRHMPRQRSPREHVLAFGGAADPRKRTDLMVAVYRQYRLSAVDPLPLVVLARAGLTDPQRVELENMGARVINNAPGNEVDRLLSSAAALLYPTTEEGFGLPILEAAEFGTPVVMDASAKVATEVLGPHCIRVGGSGLDSWVGGLREAISSGQIEGGLSLPDWRTVAQTYRSIYERVSA